ncbi:hypothetical protein JQ631_10815 [Bradyrhizobium manausense]|uniref:hypothetical protein n=1 Tax=Bradyrhizobium manausense TaxID=989370 RepID=UPI001BA906A7|nr:hypothetical protein [Bradyrhizobium manausense]MBR0789561.1 hypothetical protein [Bradyrhizobium manausense]
MSKKSNSAVSALAKALMPRPGDDEKKELYSEAGRAIIELSNAENLLAAIFCIVSNPVPYETAKEMFASQFSFERKLKLVDFMVTRANHPEEIAAWQAIYKDLKAHKAVRNLIARQGLRIETTGATPVVDVLLMPLFYQSRGKPLKVSNVKDTADKLGEINVRLWEFVKGLGSPR